MFSSIKKFNISEGDFPTFTVPQNETNLAFTPTKSPSPNEEKARDKHEILVELEQRMIHLKDKFEEVWARKLQEAKQAGHAQGVAQGVKEVEGLVQQAQHQYLQAVSQREEMLQSVKSDLVDLVGDVCLKLLGSKDSINNDVVLNLLEEGLTALGAPINATIFCHPQRIEQIELQRSRLERVAGGSILLLSNPSFNINDLRMEANNSVVKVNLEEELKIVIGELKDELGI